MKTNQRRVSIISEKLEEDFPMYYNNSIRKITRNSFSTFMADNAKRDAVILFYNSREGSTDPLRRF